MRGPCSAQAYTAGMADALTKAGERGGVPRYRWVGERGVHVATGDDTLACYARVVEHRFPELDDVVPGDGTLLLVLRPGARISAALEAALAPAAQPVPVRAARVHEIAVVYDGADLAAAAAAAGVGVDAYVALHAGGDYVVAFVGFQPGFPYLHGLPAALRAPRRATPRTRVPAGSVAVGGRYTGIYPAEGPGGWHLIGRTPARVFDPACDPPALFAPGDRVRFVAT